MRFIPRLLLSLIGAALSYPIYADIATVAAGATSQQLQVRAIVQSTGAPDTALAYNTSGLSCNYQRPGGSSTSITLATQTVTGAYSSGGFVHIANGWYRLDVPDAALATGVPSVLVTCAATGDTFVDGRVGLSPAVNVSSWNSVALGTTNPLPNAAAGATGGLATVDSNNAVKVQSGTGANQISLSSGAVTVGTNNDKTGYTASTVSDKTGYSLSQSFPTNFSSLSIDGSGRVDVAKIGGTTQTARDLGASVLLSSGTGTGQISLSSGAVLLQPTQTGVTIPTVTTLTNLPAITSNWLTASGIAADAITAAKVASDVGPEIMGSLPSGNGPYWTFGLIDQGTAQAADASSITLRSGFSANAANMVGVSAWVYSSTNGKFSRCTSTAYNDTSKVLTCTGLGEAPTGTVSYALYATPGSAIGAEVVEPNGSITRKCVEAIALAYMAGNVSTSAGTSTYKDPSNTTTRIVGTVSGSNRGTITITCPP